MCYGCSGGEYISGGSASYSSMPNYSALESTVKDYQPVMSMSEEKSIANIPVFHTKPVYNRMSDAYTKGLYLQVKSSESMYFSPSHFVNSNVPTEFISCKDEQQNEFVKSIVWQAFKSVIGKEAPKDIAIRICSSEELKKFHKLHGGKWSPGIRGFSLNRRGFGTSEVFVQEDELASLMLTLGHEIGHVITLPMNNPVDEEAKAFAFSMAWMKKVKDENIGGLFEAINPMPAKNGLHNKAFDFVVEMIRMGRDALDVYLELINGEISIENIVTC